MKKFVFKTAPPSEHVLVVGAGPSLKTNLHKVLEYISINNPIIFSANYNYSHININSHFTYITDLIKFKQQWKSITSPIIIPPRLQEFVRRKKITDKKTFLKVGIKNGQCVYKTKRVTINLDGSLPYELLGTAGFSSILVSTMCRPKMLLVGFDGPKESDGWRTKLFYDGRSVVYAKPKKHFKIMSYLEKSLFCTVRERGIEISVFADDVLYGINKKTSKLKIIT